MPMMNEINLKVNVSYGDSSLNDDNSGEVNLILFVFWGIFLPLVASIGLIGNILTIIVLWRKEMHSTTILYLRGLVITDTGILIGSVITLTPISCANYLGGEALQYFQDMVYPIIHTPGYYIVMTLQQCNVWITVSVSMERYIAICHPFRAARLITRCKTITVMVVILIISLIYNIPHLFASHAKQCDMPNEAGAVFQGSEAEGYDILSSTSSSPLTSAAPSVSSKPSSNCLEVGTTTFGKTEFYKTYRTIMYSIIIYVIPFIALLFLNCFLIRELMTMQKRRSGTNIHEENEANLSLVLVLIVIVFIFCQTPGLISQFDVIPIDVFFCWLAVSNLLFATNSAVNFLIYTAFGRKFRRVLLRVFRHVFLNKNRRSSQSSYRATHYTSNDFETMDTPASSLRSLRGLKRSKKHNGKTSETVPLNVLKERHADTENGVVPNSNGSLRGKYALSPTPEEAGEDGGKNCGSETVHLTTNGKNNDKNHHYGLNTKPSHTIDNNILFIDDDTLGSNPNMKPESNQDLQAGDQNGIESKSLNTKENGVTLKFQEADKHWDDKHENTGGNIV